MCRASRRLQVHHMVTVAEARKSGRMETITALDNLVVLSAPCHREAHRV
ncbi:MAG: hypothetical protein OXG37_16525 [Actinomycetia bacterium]|nr:hypothetical protein [Actinomycetes bacterium]